MLNAIANQLRYPNAHTHFFSCVLLALFVDSKSEAVREQVTRVLLERLIVNRPHPWVGWVGLGGLVGWRIQGGEGLASLSTRWRVKRQTNSGIGVARGRASGNASALVWMHQLPAAPRPHHHPTPFLTS